MTTESDNSGPNETIDADFEPAPAADYVLPKEKPTRSGPGWIPFGLVGAVSVAALGVSAMSLNSEAVDTAAFAPASISEEFEAIRSEQANTEQELSALHKSATAAETRMAAQIDALLSGDDKSEGLAALVTELEAVSDRLDEASIGGADSEELEALTARITVLEEADDAEAVSPRQMNRAVTALRKRVDTLETENAELTAQLETRAEALATITARIDGMEAALQGVDAATMSSGEADLLADLKQEMENLKTSVERTGDIDVENEKRFSDMLKDLQTSVVSEDEVDAAQSTAAAALALSRIEAAAREGRSFHAAFKQLQESMPGDASVTALAPIARSGAPTLGQLTAQFDRDRSKALEAVDLEADDGWGWTRKVFGSGVKVRRADEGGGPREMLDKAEEALDSGELRAAVNAVSGLPDDAKSAMEDWLRGASARLTLEEALNDIGVKMIGRDR